MQPVGLAAFLPGAPVFAPLSGMDRLDIRKCRSGEPYLEDTIQWVDLFHWFYRRGVAAYSYVTGDEDHLCCMNMGSRGPQTYFPRGTASFSRSSSHPSPDLWMSYSDSSRRASAPTEVGLGEGVGAG